MQKWTPICPPCQSPDTFFKPSNARQDNVATVFSAPAVFLSPFTDFVIESEEGIKFKVHKVFLLEASPILRERIIGSGSLMGAKVSLFFDRPTLLLPHPAWVVCGLLQYIYPIAKPKGHGRSVDETMQLIEAAQRWDIGVALSSLRDELVSEKNLESHALRVYGFASRVGLMDERRIAMRKAVQTDPTEHTIREDFQDMTAQDLLSLVDSRKNILDSALLQTAKFSHLSMTPDCKHLRKSLDASNGRGANLKAYVQTALHQRLSSDVISSTDIVSKIFLTGSSHCQACFQDISSLAQHHGAISTFKAHVDSLIDAL